MLGFPIAQHQTEGILSFLALLLAVTLLGNLAGGVDTTFPSGNDWQHFVSIGDALAREGGTTDVNGGWPTVRQRFAARTAYLLAFHEAQDARDVPRMLIADDRLARVGERDLAAYGRQVARVVAAQVAAEATARWRITRVLRII